VGVLVFGSGERAFTDRGILGAGVPGYARARGYTPSQVPTKVGARHFFPDPKFDDETDHPIPAAMGNKWDGGKAVYQERVYAAAKKFGRDQGLKKEQVDAYKPRKVA